jgi:hypothetical protein
LRIACGELNAHRGTKDLHFGLDYRGAAKSIGRSHDSKNHLVWPKQLGPVMPKRQQKTVEK